MRSLICCIFIFLAFSVLAQKKEKIEILNANELVFIDDPKIQAQRLIGDVKFRHQQAIMYCDSAYFYMDENRLEAFGHVRINQGDTLNLYGDRLDYDGEQRLAVIRGKVVRLVNSDFTLTTNKIIFDREKNFAQYHTGGTIVSKSDNNQLTSHIGYFYSQSDLFFFKNNVVLTNEDYVMNSDTMRYHTVSKIATFYGPTTITGESNLIYCENGFYDTRKDISEYYKNAYILSDGKKLEGDTLFYDRQKSYGRAQGNIQISDQSEGIIINGQKAFFYEDPDSIQVTNNALLTQIFEEDSLFMHADTFKITTDVADNKIMKAYYGVRIFKSDLQGVCDSVVYSFADSSIHLFTDPILWSDKNQLSADKIEISTSNGNIRSIFMNKNAFIISELDSSKYNQIKGLQMTAYFKTNELKQIKVKGNGQTIYYAQDELGKFIGVNKAESSNLNIEISDNEVVGITFLSKPDAIMYPMGELSTEELKYEGFQWWKQKRPLNKQAVFSN